MKRLDLNISVLSEDIVSKAVLITGSARSGTTLMGKLIHSFDKVEYASEPPLMFSLFSVINDISAEKWKLLYDTYLYEEFFISALSGRSINCNLVDDSSIYHVKALEEVNNRLNYSLRKADAEERIRGATIAYKMPGIVPYVPVLLERYPLTRVVVMLRNAVETLNSILQKKWFSPENESSALLWPFRVCHGVNVPFWVREGEDELWVKLSELDRAAYYYIRVNEGIENITGRIEISYTNLLEKPSETIEGLADNLGLEFGTLTKQIVDQIYLTHPDVII